MGVRAVEQFVAWQLADEIEKDVYRILEENPEAYADVRYRDQLGASASSVAMNITEAFHRHGTKDFARFLSMAVAALAETTQWIRDGIDRGYFDANSASSIVTLAARCRGALLALKRSLQPFMQQGSTRRRLELAEVHSSVPRTVNFH